LPIFLALSFLYAGFHNLGLIAALFFGLKAAVLAVVVEAVVRIGRRVLKNAAMIAIAALAFAGIFFFDVPFPLIVLGAGLVGFVGGRLRPETCVVIKGPAPQATGDPPALVDSLLEHRSSAQVRPSVARALRVG